jgi:hypothetical protein
MDDLVLACLLILLGAALANLLDVIFAFTPRISAWIAGRLGD